MSTYLNWILDEINSLTNINDNALIRWDWGLKNIQGSWILVDDSDNITNIASLTAVNLTWTLLTAIQTNITSVWALDWGSITSNFGEINNWASNITTSGVLRAGSIISTGNMIAGDGSADIRLNVQSNATFQFAAKNAMWNVFHFGATAGATADAVFSNSGGAEKMRITNAGDVMIGNTAVSALSEKFNVTGNGIVTEATDSGITGIFGTFGGSDILIGANSNNAVQIKTNNITAITISTSQIITFAKQINLSNFTVATLPSATTTGGFIYVSDEVGWAIPAFSDWTNRRRVSDRTIVA